MNIYKHPNILFRVEVFTYDELPLADDVMFCLGSNDVKKFVDMKRSEIGIEKYKGYSTQAVNLSSYTASIISKGLSS